MAIPANLSIPECWNDVAAGYTADLVPHFELYAQDALRLAELPPRARVLDIAAGPGTLTLLAARTAEHVVAIDFADAMLAELERRVAEADLTNVEIVQADGQSLPLEDAGFHGAFSMFGLIFFPDRQAGFREIVRVLKPGFRAVISGWAPLDQVPLLRSFFGALAELLPSLPFGDGKAPLADADEFRSEMEAAGFRNIQIHTVTHSVTVASMAEFWDSNARSSAPLAVVRKELSPFEWQQLAERVVEKLEQEYGRGAVEMSWPARLGVGDR